MAEIDRADLHELRDYTEYTDIKDVQSDFRYDRYEFDDDVKETMLWKIFKEQNPVWLKKLEKQLKSGRLAETMKFSIYWGKFQEDLMQIYNRTSLCLKAIEKQINEIESENRDATSEKDRAETEYYSLLDKIEDLTDDGSGPRLSPDAEPSTWNIDYSGVKNNRDDIEQECEDYLEEMENWKDSYYEQDNLVDHYTNLLEIAKANFDKAEDFQVDLED